MAYYVPLRMLKIGPDFAVPVHRITVIGSIDSYQLQQLVAEHRKKKTLVNASKKAVTRSVIILDNGSVITSALTLDKLKSRIDVMQAYDMMVNDIRLAKTNKREEEREEKNLTDKLMKIMKEIEETSNGEEEESDDETEDD